MISQAIRGCYLKLIANYFRNGKYNNILPVFLIPPALRMHSTIFFFGKIDKIHNTFTERAPENDLSSSHTTDRPLYYWQTSVRCADSQLWTSYFGYGKEICCEDINIIMWPWYTSSICSKNMLSHHPTYTNLGYNHVPQEWCHAICFESCCIKTASQETRCWFWAITKFPAQSQI